MKKTPFLLLLAIVLATACGQKTKTEESNEAISLHKNLPGDSTHYGLACDGCTDSIIVFLPYTDNDPDTFDIIEAMKQQRIYGRPHIGDELAVVLNPENKREALMVINLNQLHGQWCRMVMPTLRPTIGGQPARQMPDSLRKKFMVPREYGLRMKTDHTAFSMGGMRRQTTTDDMSPVEYPTVKHYTEWHIMNGRLILKADTIPGLTDQPEPDSDTADIVMLRPDTLVLRFGDEQVGFYRKQQTQE